MLTRPPAPTLASVRLATVSPGTKSSVDAFGRPSPVGYTVKKLGALGSSTVTLRATPLTPDAGTPRTPVTCTSIVPPGPILLTNPVSSTRPGVSGVNRPLPVVPGV